MRVLIDGDPIVYRAGFSAQNDWKILTWTDVVKEGLRSSPDWLKGTNVTQTHVVVNADGTEDREYEAFFAYVWEMEDFIEQYSLHEDEYEVTKWVDPLSEQFALQIVKDNIKNIATAVEGYLKEEDVDTDDMEVEVYLSGKTNFRNKVATIPGTFKKDGTPVEGYKANRADSDRPFWYQRIRDYMIEVWDATVFEGIEADDALAIVQWNEDPADPQTIICTIDKDLRNVPGWHYNVLKKTDCLLSYSEAMCNFYRQCITGDSTDNIPGCYRVKKTRIQEEITPDMSAEEMYEAALAIYKENIEKFPQRHGVFGGSLFLPEDLEGAAEGALLENARLLWMLQHEDQLWTPPHEPDGSIMEEGFRDERGDWE